MVIILAGQIKFRSPVAVTLYLLLPVGIHLAK
jgi:hypothetical protein